MLFGIYEIDHEHWAMDGAPWDYGMELFQEQTDRIEHELTLGFERYPVLQEVGVETRVNGALLFLLTVILCRAGSGQKGYWCLCSDGRLPSGRGVGKSLAEWMIHGEPEAMFMVWISPAMANLPKIRNISVRPLASLFPPVCEPIRMNSRLQAG